MEEKLRYHYQYHHHSPPPSLTDEEVGEESREEKPQKTQSHSHSCIFRSRPVILGGITNRMQGLEEHAVVAVVEGVVVVVFVVVGQTDKSISSKTLAYDCLCTLAVCSASTIVIS